MRVAVVQLSSQDEVDGNLTRATSLVRAAAAAGAKLVALPENFAFMGEEEKKRGIAEKVPLKSTGEGPILRALSTVAKDRGIFVVGGGMPEASDDPERPYNTSVLVAPDGRVVARYRKVHLFDVDLADGTKLLESAATKAGEVDIDPPAEIGPSLKMGMTICYDVRFPELYRKLLALGARVVTVPAAFTVHTGKDHWHVLLRARAIENQIFVLAPAQHGKHPRGRTTYGKSLIVDPWGDVLAQCGEGEGFAIADLDVAAQDRVRAGLPCLVHRRLSL